MANASRNDRRVKRHERARKNISGTPERPRLCVFRSNKNISAQIIDDVNGKMCIRDRLSDIRRERRTKLQINIS